MKGAFLAFLAIGVPLLLMMVAWRLLTNVTPAPQPLQESPRAVETPRPPRPASAPATLPAPLPPATRPAPAIADTTWLSDLLRRVRSDPDVQLKTAALILSERRYEAALVAFDRILVRQPDSAPALIGKAMALVGVGRYDDALPLFEHAIRLDPEDTQARFNYGVALTRAGALAQAAEVYRDLLTREPDYVQARFNLAIVKQALGNHREAIVLWRELTDERTVQRLGPTSRNDAWFHRGEAAMALFLSDEAEQSFREVLAREPQEARAWCNIGIARAASGRRAEAIEALQQALALDPKLVPAMNQLALVHAAIYRDTQEPAPREAALAWCDRSLAVQPAQQNIRDLRDALREAQRPATTPE